jgi:hypothetical protein
VRLDFHAKAHGVSCWGRLRQAVRCKIFGMKCVLCCIHVCMGRHAGLGLGARQDMWFVRDCFVFFWCAVALFLGLLEILSGPSARRVKEFVRDVRCEMHRAEAGRSLCSSTLYVSIPREWHCGCLSISLRSAQDCSLCSLPDSGVRGQWGGRGVSGVLVG